MKVKVAKPVEVKPVGIKSNLPETPRKGFVRTFLYFGSLWLLIFTLVGGSMVYFFSRDFYVWTQNHGLIMEHEFKLAPVKNLIGGIADTFFKAPGNWMEGSGSDLPQLTIDIKFKHFDKIIKKRQEALKRGILVKGNDDFIPAIIRHDGKTLRVKMRLKGDSLDHLTSGKWSFRVHVKGGKQLFGMRRFSLQHPITRMMHGQSMFNALSRELGLLTVRTKLVNVTLNGDSKGIMVLEEHFSKELLESQGKKAGVIFKFDESNRWLNVDNDFWLYTLNNVPIDTFQGGKVFTDPILNRDYQNAVGLLRAFLRKTLKPSEAFNADLMGKFIAVTDVWGSDHGLEYGNVRFYYNSISAKIEPIVYDSDTGVIKGEVGTPPSSGSVPSSIGKISRDLLRDRRIFDARTRAFKTLLHKFRQEGLLKKLQDRENELLDTLGGEFFLAQKLGLEKLVWRTECFLGVNECGNADRFPTLMNIYHIQNDSGKYLEIHNTVPYEVEIKGIEWFVPETGQVRPLELPAGEVIPKALKATVHGELPIIYKLKHLKDHRKEGFQIRVKAGIKDNGTFAYAVATPQNYQVPFHSIPIPVATASEALSGHGYLKLDAESQMFRVSPGSWEVRKPLVLPEGYGLAVSPGTRLQFHEKSFLLVRGPLRLKGTQAAPVILESAGGKASSWLGIVVMDSPQPSVWSHVSVLRTSGIQLGSWSLTGGVSFYRSDIRMEHCVLEGNRGEDALNIIHSQFQLDDVRIENTVSDGFDSDYSEGVVNGGVFRNIGSAGGGDAIDVSGSEVSVNGTRFENVSDKALSVGEKSRMVAKDLDMKDVNVGAASKDGSHLQITASTIRNAGVAGLMAYVKKPEYGPGTIEADHLVFAETALQARSQKGSVIRLNGEEVEAQDIDVKQMYKTIMKPGLRK